jgi:hypothetical protein
MYSTIPPPTPRRAEGSISNYISYYIHVNFHIYISTVTHLTYCSNKLLYSHWLFFLIVSILWILYFGVDYRYRLWYLWVYPLIFGRHVFGAGGLHPPPWSRAPRRESRTFRSIMWTHVFLLELRNCTLLIVGVWMHRGIVLSWDGIYVSWFFVEFMK